MPLSNTEFAAIMQDPKSIAEDILWIGDEDDSPARHFRAEVASNGGWPLFIQGHYNQRASRLTYALILRNCGRIYGLCLGNDHHNPSATKPAEGICTAGRNSTGTRKPAHRPKSPRRPETR